MFTETSRVPLLFFFGISFEPIAKTNSVTHAAGQTCIRSEHGNPYMESTVLDHHPPFFLAPVSRLPYSLTLPNAKVTFLACLGTLAPPPPTG